MGDLEYAPNQGDLSTLLRFQKIHTKCAVKNDFGFVILMLLWIILVLVHRNVNK